MEEYKLLAEKFGYSKAALMQLRVGRADGHSDDSYRGIVTQLLIQKELKKATNVSNQKLSEASKRASFSWERLMHDSDVEEADGGSSSDADDDAPPAPKRAKVKRVPQPHTKSHGRPGGKHSGKHGKGKAKGKQSKD
jgi:hypothetical protein